jgi:hypothetical protein
MARGDRAPAMTFSTGLLGLGFVLVGFASDPHGSKEQTAQQARRRQSAPEVPDTTPRFRVGDKQEA